MPGPGGIRIPVAAAELAHRVDSEAGLVNPQASRAPLAAPEHDTVDAGDIAKEEARSTHHARP